jgi:hypothetical protein
LAGSPNKILFLPGIKWCVEEEKFQNRHVDSVAPSSDAGEESHDPRTVLAEDMGPSRN